MRFSDAQILFLCSLIYIFKVQTREQTHETKENSLADQYAKQFALIQVSNIKGGLITRDHFYETLREPQSQAGDSVKNMLGVQ